jgi:hypothetical protein
MSSEPPYPSPGHTERAELVTHTPEVKSFSEEVSQVSNSNSVLRKKRGRPATGQDPVVTFRWGAGFIRAIDNWRNKERDKPSRSEAIRWLIGQGLHVELKKQMPDQT